MKTNIIFHKEKIITSLIALVCLSLYGLFPAQGIFQELVSSVTFLGIVPFLYVKLILKKDLKNFGLSLGYFRQGILWGLVLVVLSFLLVYTLANYTGFAKDYFIPQYSHQFFLFILNEIFIVGLFGLLYDLFFRGFLQFSFVSRLGYGAIIVQTLVFVFFLILTGNLNWSFLPYIIVAPFSGIVVFHSRSLLYSFLSSLVFFILTDAYLIHFTR